MPLAPPDVEAVSGLIAAARASGRGAAVPHLALADAAEAYRIQDAVAARLGGVAGWKVGAKGPGATPTCAPLLAGTVSHVVAGAAVRTRPVIGVEAEVAFVLGSDFPISPEGPDP